MEAASQGERWAGIALLPVLATGSYYALPEVWQRPLSLQFLPQALAYLCLGVWAFGNASPIERLGLHPTTWPRGWRWGAMTGLVLGIFNVVVILRVVPWLGSDIGFLRETPHARTPAWLMVPWLVTAIAGAVELNFRGFLLGRLLAFFQTPEFRLNRWLPSTLAVVISALTFSFDPFMVQTFKHLHWIALWDGMVWGMVWMRTRTLYATVVAHTVEVLIMYSVLKLVLS